MNKTISKPENGSFVCPKCGHIVKVQNHYEQPNSCPTCKHNELLIRSSFRN